MHTNTFMYVCVFCHGIAYVTARIEKKLIYLLQWNKNGLHASVSSK